MIPAPDAIAHPRRTSRRGALQEVVAYSEIEASATDRPVDSGADVFAAGRQLSSDPRARSLARARPREISLGAGDRVQGS